MGLLVDNLNSAMKSTLSSLRAYCKIKLLKGKIFKILLMNDDITRNCCRELIDIGLAQGFDKETWFLDALTMYKDLRDKKDKFDESVEKGMKKACIILSALYHPDKVKVDEHGEKYKVLCEEITKKINSRLGSLKGVD